MSLYSHFLDFDVTLPSATHALTPLRLTEPEMALLEVLLSLSLPDCYVKTSDSLLFYFLNCADNIVFFFFFLGHCVCSSWQEETCFFFYPLISVMYHFCYLQY